MSPVVCRMFQGFSAYLLLQCLRTCCNGIWVNILNYFRFLRVLSVNQSALVNDKDVFLDSFVVLLLRWMMLNFVKKRSNACDGNDEWAFAVLVLKHLNDECFVRFSSRQQKHAPNARRENEKE